jgi:hypothetical protein
MEPRALSLLSIGILIALPTAAPAPQTTRYLIETTIEQVQDLTAFGQGEQTITVTQSAEITVTLTDSANGKAMHVVVDSVAASGAMAPPASALAGLKGAWVHGHLDREWRASSFTASDDTSEVLAQLKATLQTFHPRLKPGFKSGETWTDTTTIESASAAAKNRTTMVTQYTAGSEEPVAGEQATKVTATFTSSSAGTLNNPMAGELQVEASEQGEGVYFVGADGRFLGGTGTATGKASVTAASLPGPIPVKTSRTSKVTVRR